VTPNQLRIDSWNELGLSGIKILMALEALGGAGSWEDVVAIARVGRGSWDEARKTLPKLGLAREEVRVIGGRARVYLELTELGHRVAQLLLRIDELLPESPGEGA